MPFDVAKALAERHGESWHLHEEFMNRQLARALRTVGFDRTYIRGEGCYLYDDAGRRYLDFLAGFGVYALGRGHPAVKAALHQALDLDLPNMVQLDCALLSGLPGAAAAGRAVRASPQRARPWPHGGPGVRRTLLCRTAPRLPGCRAAPARHVFANGRPSVVPPAPHSHPGGRGQRQRGETLAAAGGGAEEVEHFVRALDDVLADAHSGPGLFYELGWTMARGALGIRSAATARAWDAQTPASRPQAPASTGADVPPRRRGPVKTPVPAQDRGLRIEAGDRVVVTGASGFIGSAVVRALRARRADVVALVEPGADDRNLKGVDVEPTVADIRDLPAVQSACQDARFLFHLAAVYRFWAPDPQVFHDVNVGGTRNILEAAREAGCERVLYTSTVGVLGLNGTVNGKAADETSFADVAHLFGHYKRTKYVAEHEVLRAAAGGLDVCLVLPTFPLGPGDITPTPTGKLVLDFLNGRLPAFTDTAMNVVHIDDLAAGHLAALEQGASGRSYILGGENLSLRSVLRSLSDCTGLPMPRFWIPRELVLAVGTASDIIEGRVLGREPRVPLEAARMSTTKMIFDDSRARAEIGHTSRPARQAIESSARWFLDNGYVEPARRAAIRWRVSGDPQGSGGSPAPPEQGS